MKKIEVSFLIPAFNGSRWIGETLARATSAAGERRAQLIVVDNASKDGTARICESYPGVRLIRNSRNEGFSRAVNAAARASAGGILVVINQDLLLDKSSVDAICDFGMNRKTIAGGRLVSGNGNEQPSCGPFFSLVSTIARLAVPRSKRKYYFVSPPSNEAASVDWVTGAFMAFPREVFDAVGGFDEGFFMYYEDVDFCLRARQKGFPVYYLPTAQAVHMAPYAERKDAPEWLRKEVRLSQMRYFDKHRPRWEAAAIRGLNRVYFAAKGWDWPPVSKAQQAAQAE